jgi:hypothetical protein
MSGRPPTKKQRLLAAAEKGKRTKAENLQKQEEQKESWALQSAWLGTCSAERLAAMSEAEKHDPKTREYFEEIDRNTGKIQEAADVAAATLANAQRPHVPDGSSSSSSSSSSKSPMEKDMDAEVEVRAEAEAEVGVAPAEALDVAPAEAEVDVALDVPPVVEGEVLVGEGMTEEGLTMLVVTGGAAVGGEPPKHPGGFKLASIFTKGGKKVEVPQSHVEGVEQQLQHTFYCRPSFKPLIQGIIDLFEDKWTWMSCLEVVIQHKLDSILKPKDLTLKNALDHFWCPKMQLWHQCLPCLYATVRGRVDDGTHQRLLPPLLFTAVRDADSHPVQQRQQEQVLAAYQAFCSVFGLGEARHRRAALLLP